jgi:hypothetical protein
MEFKNSINLAERNFTVSEGQELVDRAGRNNNQLW